MEGADLSVDARMHLIVNLELPSDNSGSRRAIEILP